MTGSCRTARFPYRSSLPACGGRRRMMGSRNLPAPVYAGMDDGERGSPLQLQFAEELQRVGCISEYDAHSIEDEVLAAIVRAAAWAPSAANIQPWEIVALRSEEAMARV